MFSSKLLITLCAYSTLLININDCYCMEEEYNQNNINNNINSLSSENQKYEENNQLCKQFEKIITNELTKIYEIERNIKTVFKQYNKYKWLQKVFDFIEEIKYEINNATPYNSTMNLIYFDLNKYTYKILALIFYLFKDKNIYLNRNQIYLLIDLTNSFMTISSTIQKFNVLSKYTRKGLVRPLNSENYYPKLWDESYIPKLYYEY